MCLERDNETKPCTWAALTLHFEKKKRERKINKQLREEKQTNENINTLKRDKMDSKPEPKHAICLGSATTDRRHYCDYIML